MKKDRTYFGSTYDAYRNSKNLGYLGNDLPLPIATSDSLNQGSFSPHKVFQDYSPKSEEFIKSKDDNSQTGEMQKMLVQFRDDLKKKLETISKIITKRYRYLKIDMKTPNVYSGQKNH